MKSGYYMSFTGVTSAQIQLFYIVYFQKYFSEIKDNFPLQQKQRRKKKWHISFLNLILLFTSKSVAINFTTQAGLLRIDYTHDVSTGL